MLKHRCADGVSKRSCGNKAGGAVLMLSNSYDHYFSLSLLYKKSFPQAHHRLTILDHATLIYTAFPYCTLFSLHFVGLLPCQLWNTITNLTFSHQSPLRLPAPALPRPPRPVFRPRTRSHWSSKSTLATVPYQEDHWEKEEEQGGAGYYYWGEVKMRSGIGSLWLWGWCWGRGAWWRWCIWSGLGRSGHEFFWCLSGGFSWFNEGRIEERGLACGRLSWGQSYAHLYEVLFVLVKRRHVENKIIFWHDFAAEIPCALIQFLIGEYC